ncbi:hypothetical protein [Streptomyces sp. AC555_RSS877]|nr:hypothetical protein [Streptomyces sp. AC555_RSS877]
MTLPRPNVYRHDRTARAGRTTRALIALVGDNAPVTPASVHAASAPGGVL